ncbi:DsrE family protein [uncultured Cocleimonas sp.]|uniref:DsrE family protein n=1 Tax=uncultured Cocleimonas sp. TaxID=1051587 RepID=UPI00262AE89F|nr:DsrE family protein [uncultured Cocleimonas sp.]
MLKTHKLKVIFLFTFSLLSALFIASTNVFANNDKTTSVTQDSLQIAEILSHTKSPDGIVFELIGSENNDYLPNALEKIETYKKQLQAKFPELDIAVVSHGAEQFKLTKNKASKSMKSHTLVQRLVAADVPVYICETHANWRGVTPEDFPEYITTTPQGPTQIRQYQELGYTLVVVE